MTHYVPATSESSGLLLSEAVFALARPLALQSPGEEMDAFSLIAALNGSRWLVVPDEFTIVLHPEAAMNGLEDVLLPHEQAGRIPAGTIASLADWVEATRVLPTVAERTFSPWELFPPFFKDASKSFADMISAGLLAQQATP